MKHIRYIVLLLLTILVLTSCANKTEDNRDIIAVTIVPEVEYVEKVVGDKFNVVAVVPTGSSPETYEPTALEVEKILNARCYFSIGLPVENTNTIKSFKDKVKEVELDKEVEKVYDDLMLGDERDPHIWLSIKRVKVMISSILSTMVSLYPEYETEFTNNANEYLEELDSSQKYIEDKISTIKEDKRIFICYHPSFQYFADDYGLTMYALEEEGKEPTASHLEEMLDLAKEKNIKVIFYQEEMSSVQAKAYAESIGGKTMLLEPLSKEYISNLKKMADIMASVLGE